MSNEPGIRFTTSTISVRGLRLLADIGVYPEEIGCPQPLRLSVTLHVRPPAEDRIEAAYDYSGILSHARSLASQRTALVETFAQRLARMCLDHPFVLQAEVEVEKLNALADCTAGACVVLGKDVA